LRATPEPTQLERLSDASYLGKLLVLPANVRLDWKVIARYKQSSLFGLVISNKEKKFHNVATRRPLEHILLSKANIPLKKVIFGSIVIFLGRGRFSGKK
jgi:hypothetical protein